MILTYGPVTLAEAGSPAGFAAMVRALVPEFTGDDAAIAALRSIEPTPEWKWLGYASQQAMNDAFGGGNV